MTLASTDPAMPPTNSCPHCGASLAAGALAGLCPVCLLQEGALADTAVGREPHQFEPPPIAELAPLFPQLEILRLIGRGGMGAVYEARQKELDRVIALKILPPEVCAAPGFAQRFAQEARVLAKLNHPGIVTIHDFGQAGALFYFLMEFVDGVNLRQLVAGGRIEPREALAIVPEVCDALQFAHDHGVVHRDIKPENILLDRRGRVKVADFGIAKMLDTESADVGLGETQAAGTPHYMAPEQKERRRADHRADIYSLGVVLYELLTGELPTEKLEPPSRKMQIDVRLDEIVLRALAAKPELRFSTAAEFRTQVEGLVQTASASTPRVSTSAVTQSSAARPTRFSRLALLAFGILLLSPVLLATALMALRFAQQSRIADAHGTPGVPLFALTSLLYLVIPFSAPLAGTALGWLAVIRIRRAPDKYHGMWLALFDALLLPVLVMIGLFAWFWQWLLHDVVRGAILAEPAHDLPWFTRIVVDHATGLAVLATFVACILAGFGAARWLPRTVNPLVVSSPPSTTRRWLRVAVAFCWVPIFALVFWMNRPAPIGAWTAVKIADSRSTTGDVAVRIETVTHSNSIVWILLRMEDTGVALKAHPQFRARLFTRPPMIQAEAPSGPAVDQAVFLELTPENPPFESYFTSRNVPPVTGPGQAWIGFAMPSGAAAEIVSKEIRKRFVGQPRGIRAHEPVLLLFSLTARSATSAEDETLRGEISFEIEPRETSREPKEPGFGPVTELVLPNPAPGVASVLDFETGKLLTPPRELAEKFAAGVADIGDEGVQWLRESGGDAVVRMPDRVALRLFQGVAFSMAEDRGGPKRWEFFTPREVIAALRGAGWERQQRFINSGRTFYATPAHSPAALAFITREDHLGLLEVFPPADSTSGVRIRYRLVPRARLEP